MVCSFMLIVLPALFMRGIYWLWSFFTGKKAQAPAQKKEGDAQVKKGACPYHVFMNFFGFKISEKKQVPAVKANNVEGEAAQADKQVKAE